MFGIFLLAFASSTRLGVAANTLLGGFSITVFKCWACEQNLLVNKLQLSKKKYRCNSELIATFKMVEQLSGQEFCRKGTKYCKALFTECESTQ